MEVDRSAWVHAWPSHQQSRRTDASPKPDRIHEQLNPYFYSPHFTYTLYLLITHVSATASTRLPRLPVASLTNPSPWRLSFLPILDTPYPQLFEQPAGAFHATWKHLTPLHMRIGEQALAPLAYSVPKHFGTQAPTLTILKYD
ncbi:hypothetical protein Vi05172_g1567 [Venturia inaequalis]|nr:hypothetical protein Vi05172_g1567 [Venturia inaequalis]